VNLKQIRPATFALSVAGLLVLAVGTYTSNGGFQLAGGIFLLVAVVLAVNQAGGPGDEE
jgi:membrane protein implicated in regulation of membrane protease activity